MRYVSVFSLITLVGFSTPLFSQVPQPEDISKQSTHEQIALIQATEGEASLKLNTFCLDKDGQILAGCNAGTNRDGSGKGVIRIFDADGKFLTSWKVPVDPEAINVAPDGSVLVAGDGQLFRFDSSGKQKLSADSPHFEKLKSGGEALRKQVVARAKQQNQSYDRIIEIYTERVEKIKKKDEPTATDQRLLKAYEQQLAAMQEARKKLAKRSEPTEEEINQQVATMLKSKTGVSSISSDGEHVYVATRALEGYGFAIWRTDSQFKNAKEIVTGLRGCCGQMDVQANKKGIYVAENSRHRVVCFDDVGKELLTWGKGDRKGVEGFSSCCNPMNVCFGKNNDVYTAESNTGRIKRYSAKGELLDYVGDVQLVPGCKKVSIAVSEDTNRVYMLDITRNHI
ncbi:MAG: hypothetical protein KDA84_10370 [Planctomycetaceae bacterium]|nr:hypothetical protein [Planctomycetaceae bacterium]